MDKKNTNLDPLKKAQMAYDQRNRNRRNYLKGRTSARSFIRTKATIDDLNELKEMIKNKEEEIMNYVAELKELEKQAAYSTFPHVTIYKNKEELLQRNSENMGEPEEVEETYNFLKNELDYLADDREIYQIDKGNGEPSYYDDPKEAYENM